MELLIILVLIVLNGIFSMSEAAIIASRKSRLQQQAEKGIKGAQTALKLAEEPNRFLSTVQIGITLIGIMTGAIGGATFEGQVAQLLVNTPLAPYREVIAFTTIVLITTYLSLIIGELVPKRLALRAPEAMAIRVARPMNLLSRATAPVVTFLSGSTEAILWLLGARKTEEAPVTEDEITGMIRQGVEAGVFEETAHDMVEGVFSLGDRRNSTVMTPRTEVLWLNIEDDLDLIRDELINGDHSRFPVCAGDLDHVLGVVHSKHVMDHLLLGKPLDVQALMQPALTIPGVAPITRTLEMFRENKGHFALVIGEYGETLGVITLQDILEEIVGDFVSAPGQNTRRIQHAADGSLLIDGRTPLHNINRHLGWELPTDEFSTLNGLIVGRLEALPEAGAELEVEGLRMRVEAIGDNVVQRVRVFPPESAADG